MAMNVTQKIIATHLVGSPQQEASQIGIRMDQTLTQDSTGTMAYLQFEAMEIGRVKTELSVAYVDHNMLQSGFENADDHEYIRTVAKKHGIRFSRPGNGICHQIQLERFGIPGKTLIGSDSHTPTAGGIGMLAIGAGGLDVAVVMGGGVYYIPAPVIVGVRLTGTLKNGTSAKDIILELLRRLSVKGGVGKIFEYFGDGIRTLSVPERATITNMGAELGATSSLFPSDEVTRAFMKAQQREQDYVELLADAGATYDEVVDIDLGALVPLCAAPHMPDNVQPVRDLAGLKIDQVCIGSCTNSSLLDLLKAAALLKGKTIPEQVSLVISPGSRQVLTQLSECGALADFIGAGARILECACGPCIGMGQSPKSGAASLRTFNRNFEGRSGTADAQVYLVSPETAAVSAVAGVLTDPTESCANLKVTVPERFLCNDNMIVQPAPEAEAAAIEVVRGPNIKPFPKALPASDVLELPVTLKMGDNITTDHIAPAGAKLLPYRSNIPYQADYCLTRVDETFPKRAKEAGQSILVAGENYGQGSSRENAALIPLYLGIRAVFVKSFARIHRDNLINNGILPLVFSAGSDYDDIQQGDVLYLENLLDAIENAPTVSVLNRRSGNRYQAALNLSPRDRQLLLAGGTINFTKKGDSPHV